MLPKNANKVFKGIMFDVYHWKQKQFDGSYKTFEAVKRKPSALIIATVRDKLMLMKEEQPFAGKFIGLAGGIVDEKNPKKGALRELLEETGMKPEKLEFWKTDSFSKKVQWKTHYFIAKNCKKVAEQNLDMGGEKITPFLVTFEQFVDIVEKEDFRDRDFSNYIFRLKQNPKQLSKFKKFIFKIEKNGK
ncbi:MAG: NUDIX domain-containing protein [Candidatus Woesearchaeota archaeon]|jgi:ADP-ribose pyrophosphatase YjhB (NUDIX family)